MEVTELTVVEFQTTVAVIKFGEYVYNELSEVVKSMSSTSTL